MVPRDEDTDGGWLSTGWEPQPGDTEAHEYLGQARAGDGAGGGKLWGVLTYAVSEEYQQGRSPGHGVDALGSVSFVLPRLLGPSQGWASTLLCPPRGGAIVDLLPGRHHPEISRICSVGWGTVPQPPL